MNGVKEQKKGFHTRKCEKGGNKMKRKFTVLFIAMISVISMCMMRVTNAIAAETYDLVILNGRVMDPETKLDAVRNVGVNDGKIVVITKDKIQGDETIDATGHVVAPGFIDMHDHNTAAPFGQKLALRDGVTTPMELEAGVYPVDTWYDYLEGKSQTNYGASVGTIPVRETLLNPAYKTKAYGDFLYDMQKPKHTHTSMKWSTQLATAEQIEEIGKMLE